MVNKDTKRKIKIMNEQCYLWMLEEEQQKKSQKSHSSESKEAKSQVIEEKKGEAPLSPGSKV